MDYVQVKNSLKNKKAVDDIVNIIINKIKADLTVDNNLKSSMELLTLVVTLIENLIDNHNKPDKKKVNKLNVLHDIYNKLFGNLTQQDLTLINQNIEYLLDNKLIKKYSFLKRVYKNIKHWIQKKGF
jgi:DNA phosphorothioation-dependent restriction protein DptG